MRIFIALLAGASSLLAQGTTPAMLLKPPADSWPAYHGDYSGQRHSSLTQITPENVRNMGLAWAFQTGPDADAEVLAAAGGWRPLHHRAR